MVWGKLIHRYMYSFPIDKIDADPWFLFLVLPGYYRFSGVGKRRRIEEVMDSRVKVRVEVGKTNDLDDGDGRVLILTVLMFDVAGGLGDVT